MMTQEWTFLSLRVVRLVGSAVNIVYCVHSKTENKDLLLNTNSSQGLNTTLCVEFFCSSWREIDHTPELLLNHSTQERG